MRFNNPPRDAHLAGAKHPVDRIWATVASRHRGAETVSSAAAYVLTSFAIVIASLYPEIYWPLLAYLKPSFWAQRECYSRNTNSPSLKSFGNALGSVS